jgi:FkbM family methyltransferase
MDRGAATLGGRPDHGWLWRLARAPYRALERSARRVPALQRLVRTIGAATRLQQPIKFGLRELGRRNRVSSYRLRGTGLSVILRQPRLDLFVLEEVFRSRVYELPPPVQERLATLDRRLRVVDLGGYVGIFGLFMFGELEDIEVISYEPDPAAFRVLERCRIVNGLERRWRVAEAFAATEDGSVEFLSSPIIGRLAAHGDDLEATRRQIEARFPFTERGQFATATRVRVRAQDVLPELAGADLAKIDIEGAEWPILQDPRFADAGPMAIVLEYHKSGAPQSDIRAAVREILQAAGYTVGEETSATEDAGVLFAWRA